MNRELVLGTFKKVAMKELEKIEGQLGEGQEKYRNSPGAMQSASDTSRSELEWEMDKDAKIKDKYSKLIADLEKIELRSKSKKVSNNSLVQVKRGKRLVWYLIIDGGTGMKAEMAKGIKVYVISKYAPIAQCIFGLKKNDKKEFHEEVIEVKNIM